MLEFVGLNGFGEPLLHRTCSSCSMYAGRIKFKPGISTNCTRLDEETARALLDNPRSDHPGR